MKTLTHLCLFVAAISTKMATGTIRLRFFLLRRPRLYWSLRLIFAIVLGLLFGLAYIALSIFLRG